MPREGSGRRRSGGRSGGGMQRPPACSACAGGLRRRAGLASGGGRPCGGGRRRRGRCSSEGDGGRCAGAGTCARVPRRSCASARCGSGRREGTWRATGGWRPGCSGRFVGTGCSGLLTGYVGTVVTITLLVKICQSDNWVAGSRQLIPQFRFVCKADNTFPMRNQKAITYTPLEGKS